MEQEDEEDHDHIEEEEEEDDEEGGDEDENDEATLYDLADLEDLQGTLARLKELARQDAVQELLYRDGNGTTALHLVLFAAPSLELLTAICNVMKDDRTTP